MKISKQAEEFISAVKACKGQYLSACIHTTVKPAATHKDKELTKRTTGVYRTGIEYANLKKVREAVEAGERGEPGGLPWGKWAVQPWIIEHKEVEYVRLYQLATQKPQVEYFVNGEKVTKEDFVKLLIPSQQQEKEVPDALTVKLANVRFIGCYTGPEADEE